MKQKIIDIIKLVIFIILIIPTLPFTIYFMCVKPAYHVVEGFELLIDHYIDWVRDELLNIDIEKIF